MVATDPGPPVATEANTVLVLDLTAHGRGYLVASLSEDGPDKDAPYKLSLLGASSVPAGLEGLVVRACPPHLLPSRPVHVVVSAKSGTGLAARAWESVVRPLLELLQGLDAPKRGAGPVGAAAGYRTLVTESEDSIREFARANLGGGGATPTVILLAGDGGVSDLLNGRGAAPAVTVAPLPFGTGNALFHSLHRPMYSPGGASPLVLGLRTLWKGRPAALPVFSARFSAGARIVRAGRPPGAWEEEEEAGEVLGAVVFSHGFHASLVWESDTPRYREHGAARFGMVAAELLREGHAYEVAVSVRGPAPSDPLRTLRRVPGEAADGGGVSSVGYVLVSMVSNLEETFAISPRSEPLDGRMRLVHFGAVGGGRTMEIMKAAYDGGAHVDMEDVGYEEVGAVEMTVLGGDARWRKVCVDGIIVQVPEGGKVCLGKAEAPIQVLVQ